MSEQFNLDSFISLLTTGLCTHWTWLSQRVSILSPWERNSFLFSLTFLLLFDNINHWCVIRLILMFYSYQLDYKIFANTYYVGKVLKMSIGLWLKTTNTILMFPKILGNVSPLLVMRVRRILFYLVREATQKLYYDPFN